MKSLTENDLKLKKIAEMDGLDFGPIEYGRKRPMITNWSEEQIRLNQTK